MSFTLSSLLGVLKKKGILSDEDIVKIVKPEDLVLLLHRRGIVTEEEMEEGRKALGKSKMITRLIGDG